MSTPEFIIEPSPMVRLSMTASEELERGCIDPRASALRMVVDVLELASSRGVVPGSEGRTIIVGLRRGKYGGHVEPLTYSHPVLSIDIALDGVDVGKVSDMLKVAHRASSRASGWESIFFELMRGVCE